jgi:hypothetical protein
MSGNGNLNSLWLASSVVIPGIFSNLIFAVMMNRFLRGSPYFRRYLQPQRQDDPVLEMLMRMIYSDSHFVDPEFRLRLMSQFGLTIFLMNALMRPDGIVDRPVNRFIFYGIDRVKRWFPSPPAQIERAIAMLSNPFFQTPPFHLSFSMEGFVNWDNQLRFNLMKYLLLSIPSDFDGLPDFLVVVRQLMLTENRFWMGLVEVFICHYYDNRDQCDDEEKTCPGALQNLLTQIKSSFGSKDLWEFERLFQPTKHVPNDRDSFLQVIEQFVTCMIQSLPSLPRIQFEDDVIVFSPRTQLSPEGHALSARILQILRNIHDLKISEDLINLIRDKNFEDTAECLAYRGFEILLNIFQLIQKSNGAIYTLIHAHILDQTSARPDERRKLCAMRDLFNLVHDFVIDNGDDDGDDFKIFTNITFSVHSYLHSGEKFIPFLMDFLLSQNFLQTLEVLLQCKDDFDLEDFAQNFMDNSEFVVLFRRHIQENPKTWCRA